MTRKQFPVTSLKRHELAWAEDNVMMCWYCKFSSVVCFLSMLIDRLVDQKQRESIVSLLKSRIQWYYSEEQMFISCTHHRFYQNNQTLTTSHTNPETESYCMHQCWRWNRSGMFTRQTRHIEQKVWTQISVVKSSMTTKLHFNKKNQITVHIILSYVLLVVDGSLSLRS